MASGKLKDQVAVVTGGASGIGKATAQLFADEGAKVVIGDVQGIEGENVAKTIGGIYQETDVRESKQVERLVERARKEFGRLDVMFNNAGIELTSPLVATDDEAYRNLIRINLDGVFFGLKYAGKVMMEQRRGTIVNTASVAGLRGAPMLSAYNAAKGGVVLLTKNAALEFASAGVRVNCVCPGVIETPMVMKMLGLPGMENLKEQLGKAHPLGRMGKPEEVARAVLFLACDDSSFITGHSLVIDGGLTAGAGGGGSGALSSQLGGSAQK
jgi:NAD(P)-dependent dehydrogenase (short-subunit alcohol dehydrogenase family)